MWRQIKHFFRGIARKNKKIVACARERSEEFNQRLLEVRTRHSASRNGDALTVAPERWYHITLGEFSTQFFHSLSSEGAKETSPESWGLFEQVARVFAKDGRHVVPEDIEAMCGLVRVEEDPDTVTLATLFERHIASVEAHDRLKFTTKKVKGR